MLPNVNRDADQWGATCQSGNTRALIFVLRARIIPDVCNTKAYSYRYELKPCLVCLAVSLAQVLGRIALGTQAEERNAGAANAARRNESAPLTEHLNGMLVY